MAVFVVVQVVARALQLAEVLMQKLPSVFLRYFAKEGVVHAIDQLAAAASPPLPVPKEPKRKGRRQSPRAKVGLPCNAVLPTVLAAQAAVSSIAHQICQPLRPLRRFRSWCIGKCMAPARSCHPQSCLSGVLTLLNAACARW